MESSLKNMVLVLFTITLLSSAAVGGVYMITQEPIAQAKQAAVTEALKQVLPDFEATTEQTIEVSALPIVVHTATTGEQTVGYAVESISKNGFGGVVRLMVGFDPNGKILNINVLEQKETPGLGTKMADQGNVLLLSFQGKNAAELKMTVRKDGGDIDALTAATISSRAYTEAVAVAYEAFKVASGAQTEAGDVASGATKQEKGGDYEQ